MKKSTIENGIFNENSEVIEKTYNKELIALLSMRNTTKSLQNHYDHLLKLEGEANELDENTLLLIRNTCNSESAKEWEDLRLEVQSRIIIIKQILSTAIGRISKKESSNSSEMWEKFDSELKKLKNTYQNFIGLGCHLLPENQKNSYKTEACKIENNILPLFLTYAEICKIDLQVLEKYTKAEIEKITKIINDLIPENYTIAQADKYEEDYKSAMKDLKKEFSENKNLWDQFLDILAGGTHQSPAEHVMMERWLEGNKGELEA